ncbi:MAG: peptidoglycan DD-metalloendopeptidase family protein [Cyanobacteria bacterium P01_F01_bin.13]
MKRANSQEPKSETSHSCFSNMGVVNEQAPSGNAGRSPKSAAVLGLALSFGASGVLFADSEATAAVGSFVVTNSAASSELPQLPSVLKSQLNQSSAKAHGSAIYHTVEQGDSLWQIAKDHQVEIQDIKVANRIFPDAPLQVGQVIKVPSEEGPQPTLVSLLPGVQQRDSNEQSQPTLESLIAGLPDSGNGVEQLRDHDASDSVDSATVVATEELTGDTSLRSAGLVSQSDGFQADLKQLAANSQLSSVQAVTTDDVQSELSIGDSDAPVAASYEDSEDMASEEYEVIPGDTVEDIAIALGTTSEELAEVNDLDDPNFILAGDTLSVPEEVTSELVLSEAAISLEQAAPKLTASSSLSDFDGTRLSRLQSTVENRINGSQRLQQLQTDQQTIESQTSTAGVEDEVALVTVEDPYTADLLAEVSSAQQLNTSVEMDDDIALKQAVLEADTVVNPEFQENRLEARALDDAASKQSELLAAAPLDPNVYVSSPTPTAGQVVSPEMPILPSADEYLPESPDYFNGYIWPTRGTLTSGYGWRWGRMHRGIDVAGPVGTPIVSAAPGIVERAGWNSGGYGNLVEVRHADGSMTRYAHNSRIVVRSGQRVAQGQHIADMGSTGYSTGPHLHFEVHMPDRGTVNPMAMLPSR